MTVSTPAAPAANVRAYVRDFFVNLSDWLQNHWFQILIAAAVAAVIVAVLYAVRGFGRHLCRPDRPTASWMTIAGKVVSRTTGFFIVMVAVRLVMGYAAPPWSVAVVIGFLFTVALVLQGAIWARELILGFIEHRTSAEHYRGEAVLNAMGLIRLLVNVAVFAIAIVVLLDNLGVNVTGLVAGLGIGGIAIGLAAQGIFADLFAALAIIFDRPFSRGDAISYDGSSGTIESIGLKSTRIRAYSGELRIIANRNLLDKEILNVTGRDHIRLSFTIRVAYETPPETLARIPEMLKELVEAEDATPARAGFETFSESSLDFALLVDVPGNDWPKTHAIRDRLLVSIMRRFADEGIAIPYPTQTTYTAAPDGHRIMPYPEVQPVKRVDGEENA